MQVSPGLKPNLLEEMSLFSMKNWNISLNINLSRIFPQIGCSDTGRYFFNVSLPPFFVSRNNVTLFPFRRKDTSFNALIENLL